VDEAKRTELEERRRFMKERNKARTFRAAAEPAISNLQQAGEDFRVYRLGDEPEWAPDWIPAGYGHIPWDTLPGVNHSPEALSEEALVDTIGSLLEGRLPPFDKLLVVADVGDWTIELERRAFDRHALIILETCCFRCWLAAPPAQWLIAPEGRSLRWKDG
jgi:hypothetical protein